MNRPSAPGRRSLGAAGLHAAGAVVALVLSACSGAAEDAAIVEPVQPAAAEQEASSSEPPPAASPSPTLRPAASPSPTPTPPPPDERALPDLAVLTDSLLDASVEEVEGRLELSFTTGIGNYGLGPLEVHGSRDTTEGGMAALQRVYTHDGDYEDVYIGSLEYVETHGHWHFAGLALYELETLDGTVILAATKAGFCIVDSYHVDPAPPGGPAVPEFYDCSAGEPFATLVGPFGLSSGWYDEYEWWLPGQSLDVTDVPSGTYILRVTVNPDGVLVEADAMNNSASVFVEVP